MQAEELKQNITVYGPLFPEPVQVIIAVRMGDAVKLVGKGVRSESVRTGGIARRRHFVYVSTRCFCC
jgi:hypothetical protein